MLGYLFSLFAGRLVGGTPKLIAPIKKMGFGDLKSRSGLETLNKYLEDKSYIEGYVCLVCPLLPYNIYWKEKRLLHVQGK